MRDYPRGPYGSIRQAATALGVSYQRAALLVASARIDIDKSLWRPVTSGDHKARQGRSRSEYMRKIEEDAMLDARFSGPRCEACGLIMPCNHDSYPTATDSGSGYSYPDHAVFDV